jgi:thiol-disulfide isomerase/thioredoxin
MLQHHLFLSLFVLLSVSLPATLAMKAPIVAQRVPHKQALVCSSSVLSLRGGAVLEPTSLQDVESMLKQAEGKLVVIDFSATWYVCVFTMGRTLSHVRGHAALRYHTIYLTYCIRNRCGPCKMIAPLVRSDARASVH